MHPFLRALWIFVLLCQSISPSTDFQVSIVNGTYGKSGKVDRLKVYLLKEGMVPVKEFLNVAGKFHITNLDIPENLPILIQAEYKGITYNKMVPPIPQARKEEIPIEVYELSQNPNSLDLLSLIQFTKTKGFLQVLKVYIIQNQSRPKTSIQYPDGFHFYIPSQAQNLNITWSQGELKMPIPIQWESLTENHKKIHRGFLPGTTEIQIAYTIPWDNGSALTLSDQNLMDSKSLGKRIPIFLKPEDMNLEIQNGELEELQENIPEGYKAYLATYKGPQETAHFILSGGTPIPIPSNNQTRKIVNGGLLQDWQTSLAVVIGIVSMLYLLQFATESILQKTNLGVKNEKPN